MHTPSRRDQFRIGRFAGIFAAAVPLAFGVGAALVAAADNPANTYAAIVLADDPLAFWPLADSLEPARVADGFPAALEVGGGAARFRPGPMAGNAVAGGSVDLGRGGWLRLPPAPALDGDELTIEMIFQIKYPKPGALFGIRDGAATRFSLHCTADSPVLKLWNGSQVTEFEADRSITLNEWCHVALAISPTEATVWLNGVRCRPSGETGLGADGRGLPLLVGCSNAAGTAERSEILAARLALYPRRLPDERIAARAAAVGLAEPATVE